MPSNPRALKGRLFPTAHRLLLEKRLRRELPNLSGRILVIGAGYNPYDHLFSDAAQIFNTDIDPTYGQLHVVADAHELPFSNESFDVVVAIEVLEHLHSPNAAVREAHRVLRVGGTVFASVPFMFHVHGDPWDFTRFTESGLEKLFDSFSNLKINPFGGRLHVISDILTTVAKPFAALRPINHLLAVELLPPSSDCPSGYIVSASK